jgi:hypothetical protein
MGCLHISPELRQHSYKYTYRIHMPLICRPPRVAGSRPAPSASCTFTSAPSATSPYIHHVAICGSVDQWHLLLHDTDVSLLTSAQLTPPHAPFHVKALNHVRVHGGRCSELGSLPWTDASLCNDKPNLQPPRCPPTPLPAQAMRSDTLSLSRLSDRLWRAKSTFAQNRIACGALQSIVKSPRRALVDLTDTHFWRLQLPIVAMRNMTVAWDGGAGAQAGVRHRDGRTPRPYRLRRTHAPGLMCSDSRPVKLADSPPSTYRGARRCAGMRTAQADKMPNLVDL